MAETITILANAGGFDDDGNPLSGGISVGASVKSVQPLSLEEISEDDRQGVKDALRVWGSALVKPGDRVEIRGVTYRVVKSSWNWGQGRRAANQRHKPSIVFDCVRGVG